MSLESKELANSVIKSAFAAIPFVGQPLNELFYDYRGRIKQERLNLFSDLLTQHFQKHGPVDFNQLNHVEFSDLFESVILSVVKTGSKEKHRRFRDILINYIENPGMDIDYTETYLDLINNLNENAIKIMHIHNKYHEDFLAQREEDTSIRDQIHKRTLGIDQNKFSNQGLPNNYDDIKDELKRLNEQLILIEQRGEELQVFQKPEFYNMTEDEYIYLKQVLSSKGLITDILVGTFGHVPFNIVRTTKFGREFMDFITREH